MDSLWLSPLLSAAIYYGAICYKLLPFSFFLHFPWDPSSASVRQKPTHPSCQRFHHCPSQCAPTPTLFTWLRKWSGREGDETECGLLESNICCLVSHSHFFSPSLSGHFPSHVDSQTAQLFLHLFGYKKRQAIWVFTWLGKWSEKLKVPYYSLSRGCQGKWRRVRRTKMVTNWTHHKHNREMGEHKSIKWI